MSDRATPLDQMLCFALYGATQAIQQSYKPLLEPFGLTYLQYLSLRLLWAGDGVTVGQLCAALGLETSTLTPLLKRMEAAGLLTRARGREDERQVRVTLTERGRALEPALSHVPGCIGEATGLPPQAIEDMTAILQSLSAQLRASRSQAQRAASATTGSPS